VLFPVGRVGENQFKGAAALDQLRDGDVCVLRAQLKLVWLQIERFEVPANHPRGPRRFFHNHRPNRAATERLERERAGTAEKLENRRSVNSFAQAVEDRLFDQIGRGADVVPFWYFQNSTAGFS